MLGRRTKVDEDALRRELEAKVATHTTLAVRIPMQLMVDLKRLSLETGISLTKISCFLLENGMEKLDKKHAAATVG